MRHGASGRSLFRLFGVLILVVGVLPMTVASATSGYWEISDEGATVTLTEDHTGTIAIVADNITLDCRGHLVNWEKGVGEPNEWSAIGVLGTTGVTVKNCEVSGDYDIGFYVEESDQTRLTKNTAAGIARIGFLIGGSHDTVIDRNLAEGNRSGINVSWSTNTLVQANTISRSTGGYGLYLGNSVGSTVLRNTVSHSFGHGILIGHWPSDAPGVISFEVAKNISTHNGLDGIRAEVRDGDEAVVVQNDTWRNFEDGIQLGIASGAPTLQVGKNSARFNGELGIEVDLGGTDLGGNEAKHNGEPEECTPNLSCHVPHS